MYLWLPESLQFLALRRNDTREIGKWLKRIDPAVQIDATTRFVVPEARAPGVPIAHLFAEGRAAATSLIWVANFMNIVNAYFVASWLPTVVRDMGYSTSIGVMTGATVQAGGVIGTLAIAGIVARVGFARVLVACFAVETVAIALIGQPGLSLAMLFVVAFLTGWGIFGGQPTLNSLSATYYPTDLRSTGIGAALGVGRVGAIIGPAIGGAMLGAQWSNEVGVLCGGRARRDSDVGLGVARAGDERNGGAEGGGARAALSGAEAPPSPLGPQFAEAIAVEATALVARSLTTSMIVTTPRRSPAVAISSDESKIVTIPRSASRVVADGLLGSADDRRAAHFAVTGERERHVHVCVVGREALRAECVQRQQGRAPTLGRLERELVVGDRDRKRLAVRGHVAAREPIGSLIDIRPAHGARVCERDDLTLLDVRALRVSERDRSERQRGSDCDANGGCHTKLPVRKKYRTRDL